MREQAITNRSQHEQHPRCVDTIAVPANAFAPSRSAYLEQDVADDPFMNDVFGIVYAARRAGHMLLGEPLDGAGNRRSGSWAQRRQVRDLAWTRPCASGFPSVARDAPLARFAAAACVRPRA